MPEHQSIGGKPGRRRRSISGTASQTDNGPGGEASIVTPLLPLAGDVLFPGTTMRLTLAGEQAHALLRAAERSDWTVALFLQKELSSDTPSLDDLHSVGTLARIKAAPPGDDGAVEATAAGLVRVRLDTVEQWEPCVLARVLPLSEETETRGDTSALFDRALGLYLELLTANPAAVEAYGPALEAARDPHRLAYLIGSTLPISPAGRQSLLENSDPSARLSQLLPVLLRARELNASRGSTRPTDQDEGSETLQGEASLRPPAAGWQGELLPTEHAQLRERLLAAGLPPDARTAAERELERLAAMSAASPEYTQVQGYLQWLADLPWTASTRRAIDLDVARETLDRDHYGLEGVKARILEYLAVRKLRQERGLDAERGEIAGRTPAIPGDPVLCLTGPPGIGKTSLGRSIAAALDRPFVRISLGGVGDEADIRGHRRTYMGAMPGKIIQGLARVGSSQAVVMLDEIDKVGSGGKGDPASALLEVLDSEQQRAFLDHYVDVPYDLSGVFFIATANMLDGVPPALRDRLEVVQLSGYTEEEKVEIALRHIIPRQMEWHALHDGDVEWLRPGVLAIARGYTREAGVRQLEREIATVCRRLAMLVAQADESGQQRTVGPEAVSELLGSPRFLPEPVQISNVPGVATGVVWTPVGGDIIHVESSIMPGRETLTVTGQLGEVMKESAHAALSYVRAHATELGIDPSFFERHDIHLHVPSGAVPKDGPSAGVTLAAALVSLLTGRAVPTEVAMTGELTLSGRVLPVGGIKEKVLAARRAGIRKVILPAQNRRDFEDIPDELVDEMEITFAESMNEVIAAAFSSAGACPQETRKARAIRTRATTSDENEMGLPRAARQRAER